MSKELSEKKYEKRTKLQNKALHLYYDFLAKSLNDAGLDMRAVLKPEVEIPWSKDTIKKYLWRPIQMIQLGKKSTTELNTNEVDLIKKTLDRHLGEKFGIYEEFPSIQRAMDELDKIK